MWNFRLEASRANHLEMIAMISERCKLGHRAALAKCFLAAQYVVGPGSPDTPHSNSSSTATEAQGSCSHHHWGSSGVQTETTSSTQNMFYNCSYASGPNIYMHVCICMHLLYTDIYLHIKHFNSICIQNIAELKDSATTGVSTKNTPKSQLLIIL